MLRASNLSLLKSSANHWHSPSQVPLIRNFLDFGPPMADMRERQESYIAGSKQVTREMVERWPWQRRLFNNAIAMLGPVL